MHVGSLQETRFTRLPRFALLPLITYSPALNSHYVGSIHLPLTWPPLRREPPNEKERTISTTRRFQPWFEDGNIILEAEVTQLCIGASWLPIPSFSRTMFEFGKPTNEGSVEGCPLVQLSDSAEDLQYVLEVLHNAHSRCAYWHWNALQGLTFHAACSPRYTIKNSRPLANVAV